MKHLKNFEGISTSNDSELSGSGFWSTNKEELKINKISRYLSDMFYPKVSKNTYPIKCSGFTELEHDYEAYFLIWDEEKNDYKEYPVTTIFVPKHIIK